MARDISWPVCWPAKKPELELLQVRVEQRAQVVLDRQRHLAGDQPPHDRQPEPHDATTPTIASASVAQARPCRASEIWSTARPVSHGIATVQTIASAASSSDQKTPALVRAQETEESTKGVHATTP